MHTRQLDCFSETNARITLTETPLPLHSKLLQLIIFRKVLLCLCQHLETGLLEPFSWKKGYELMQLTAGTRFKLPPMNNTDLLWHVSVTAGVCSEEPAGDATFLLAVKFSASAKATMLFVCFVFFLFFIYYVHRKDEIVVTSYDTSYGTKY